MKECILNMTIKVYIFSSSFPNLINKCILSSIFLIIGLIYHNLLYWSVLLVFQLFAYMKSNIFITFDSFASIKMLISLSILASLFILVLTLSLVVLG